MDIIDAHHHVWNLSHRDQDWITGPELEPLRRDFDLAHLEPEARAAGVAATVLVQTVTVAEETPELLALAADSDLVGAVVGWSDLTAPGIAEELARLLSLPGGEFLAGLRHQVQAEADPLWLIRTEVLRGLRSVAAAGLAYDLVIRPHHLPAAVRAATLVPELTFVLDHLGKPPIAVGALRPWADHLRDLAALPNTVAKLSGLHTEAGPAAWTVDALRPYVDTALDAFGPTRLMFGSDWPVSTLAADYRDIVTTTGDLISPLSPGEQSAVWSQTAHRVYGIPLHDGT